MTSQVASSASTDFGERLLLNLEESCEMGRGEGINREQEVP
jgi:hypothetical protein